MVDIQDQPVVEQLGRPLRLVPVGLKEAAFDSPTFRATAIHFSDQVEVVERWLGEYLKAATKLVNEAQSLEDLVNGWLYRSIPPSNLSEAVLDHDYTFQIMRRFAEGARQYWSHAIAGTKKMESVVLEPIRSFLHAELRNFKDARQYLIQAQRNFDTYHSRYAAQSRTKELSALREDAFQLFEVRRLYLRASMEFCLLAPQLRLALDRLLVRMFSDGWRELRNSSAETTAFLSSLDGEVDRIRTWSIEMETSDKTFKQQLQAARRQLEESAAAAARPSRELEEYSTSMLPSSAAKGQSTATLQPPMAPDMKTTEKQGWLFLKTLSGKPSKTLWVRRWFYVRNGIFGWLVLGGRSGGVEESEQIGVLLCSVRPASQEERRFCFEVKTKDNTIVIQAESQTELAAWLEVFEKAKKAALEDTNDEARLASGSSNRDAAFAITPPSMAVFAAKQSDGLGVYGSEDSGGGTALPDARTNLDINSRRSTASERDGESVRDSASRIIQKLDLHRKSAAGSQLANSTTGGPSSAGLGHSSGAKASLLSAGYNVPSLQATPTTGSFASTLPLSVSSVDFASAGVGIANGSSQRAESSTPSTLAPMTLTNPPAPTNLSKAAAIYGGERGVEAYANGSSGSIPCGIMANFWGTISSPIINHLELENPQAGQDHLPQLRISDGEQRRDLELDGHDAGEQLDTALVSNRGYLAQSESSSPPPRRAHRNTLSSVDGVAAPQQPAAAADNFPPNYPTNLRIQDAQFRILFPNVPRHDKVVYVFRAAWNPDERLDFPGRVYLTAKDLYFYSHHLGLVLTSSMSLGSIDGVTAATEKAYDHVFLNLKKGSSEGFTRVTIKNFLEPIRLLRRRLNFLVDNFHSEQPLRLEAIVDQLTAMEKDIPTESPSLASWEDVSIEAPENGVLVSGNNDPGRKERDLRTTIRVDQSLVTANVAAKKDSARLKLPSEPVLYSPEDLTLVSQAKEFPVSAKALFHVMFGDKSTVFQTLYLGRRTQQEVKQSPWARSDEGILRRDFEYSVNIASILGSVRRIKICDSQDVDILNDHLCYVVQDMKVPWHLPRWKHFRLLSKIVITHISKSKCKLTVYVGTRWSRKSPVVQRIINRQGIVDLNEDARLLTEVLTDQVSRLGREAQTKKAVTIFGHVGQQTEVVAISPAEASGHRHVWPNRLEQLSLARMVFETLCMLAERCLASALCSVVAGLPRIVNYANVHRLILCLFGLSLLANVFFTSKEASEWWSERKALRYMSQLGVGPDMTMRKTISLEVLDELVAPLVLDVPDSLQGRCYSRFRAVMSLDDDAGRVWAGERPAMDDTTRRMADYFTRLRDELGEYRHELVVSLRVTNKMEQELVEATWERWLEYELAQCRAADKLLRETAANTDPAAAGGRDIPRLQRWLVKHCGSCQRELDHLQRDDAVDQRD